MVTLIVSHLEGKFLLDWTATDNNLSTKMLRAFPLFSFYLLFLLTIPTLNNIFFRIVKSPFKYLTSRQF